MQMFALVSDLSSLHVKPKSVSTYLSGICNQLEPFFPEIRSSRHAAVVAKTLAGCMRLYGTPPNRKAPLTRDTIQMIADSLGPNDSFDNRLFMSVLLTGFYGLMRLGELVVPDNKLLRNHRKLIKVFSVKFHTNSFDFLLPSSKNDQFFEGNKITIHAQKDHIDPLLTFRAYFDEREQRFPLSTSLWITSTGAPLTRYWFITRLKQSADENLGGHSLRAGGATYLAQLGVAPFLIQAAGRWDSDTWQQYVRKHPILMHALMFAQHHEHII